MASAYYRALRLNVWWLHWVMQVNPLERTEFPSKGLLHDSSITADV